MCASVCGNRYILQFVLYNFMRVVSYRTETFSMDKFQEEWDYYEGNNQQDKLRGYTCIICVCFLLYNRNFKYFTFPVIFLVKDADLSAIHSNVNL